MKNWIDYPSPFPGRKERFSIIKLVKSVSKSIQTSTLTIACSAGLDSTCLVKLVHQAIKHQNLSIQPTILYINHNFRTKENEQEILHVQNLARQYGFNVVVENLNLGSSEESGLQDRAHKARYEVFERYLNEENSILLTAHNKNDVVETKLFQFLKGKKVTGIAKERQLGNGKIVRPLVGVSREELENYAQMYQLTWCEDSSNATDKYSRNKIRHHLIPWIQENINPGVLNTLAHSD